MPRPEPPRTAESAPIVHVIGCRSIQYGTFEDNLVALARTCAARGSRVVYVYPSEPAEERFRADVREAGGEIEVAPGTDSSGVAGAKAIGGVIRRLRPRVLHAHFGRPGYVSVFAARSLGVSRILLTKHHASWPSVTKKHAAALRAVAACADNVVCVSEAVRAESLAAGIPADKLLVLPFGVRASTYARDPVAGAGVRREIGVDPASPFVLCVSHLRQPKGVEVLIDAWRQVSERFPDAVLVIAGDGPMRRELEERASRVAGRILFLGLRPDVPALLSACDVFACPARGEGGGLNVVEALCAGVPAVSTPVSVLDGAGREDIYVRIAGDGEPAPISEGVIGLLSDPARAATLAGKARKHLTREFAVETAVERIADLYFKSPLSSSREAIA